MVEPETADGLRKDGTALSNRGCTFVADITNASTGLAILCVAKKNRRGTCKAPKLGYADTCKWARCISLVFLGLLGERLPRGTSRNKFQSPFSPLAKL